MFGGIASRYDLANHTLSCGLDFYWRKCAADTVVSWRPAKIADLATGTGDLAIALQKKIPGADVTGVDFLPEMLDLAQKKGVRKTILADAMKLPFPDASFDCVTIAFGLRNMENWKGALVEMSRVLRRKGHLLVLEFSLPNQSIVRTIYRFYLHRCLPLLGSLLTSKKSAYDYLGDSIEEFPSGAAMIDLIEASGFEQAAFQPLSYGIATIYTAQNL
jgi:demethylmenaquinone methyltransferase / 2-methoxy-6-polyprenyl-1,4-benzoquinol methylase